MPPTAARCSAGRRTFARRNGCAAVPKLRPPRPQQLLLVPRRARFFGGRRRQLASVCGLLRRLAMRAGSCLVSQRLFANSVWTALCTGDGMERSAGGGCLPCSEGLHLEWDLMMRPSSSSKMRLV